jgi:hypothetical protein
VRRRDIATTCITYLLFDDFETGFCPTDEEFESRLQLNALYDYAARNWGYHARAASTEVEQLTLDLLESETKASGSSQVIMISGVHRVPTRMTGVHLAAYFGLLEAVVALLKNEDNPNSKDYLSRTPLSWAARVSI